MDVTPTPEFILSWLRANHKGVEQTRVPPEEFFAGCTTVQEKHKRVAAVYPDAYERKRKRRAK